MLLRNTTVILPNEKAKNVSVLIENGEIARITNKKISADETLDLSNATLYAGFIDIHNHGAVGADVNSASAEDLREISNFLAGKGVTAWLPTLVPDSDENYGKIIKAIDELMETQIGEPIAQILGVHYEGVFANEKMCGALRPQFFKTFKRGDEIKSLPRLKNGVHLTTLAPEVENGIELVRELKKQNWIVSIGHTKADLETLDKAFEAGAKHLTHFFNAMTGLHHRDVGVVGWALTKDEVTFDIIADGVHIAAPILKFGVESKGTDKVSLISDSVAPTGLGDGNFDLWNEKISVVNGKTQNERGNIAGSVITMLDAVEMVRELGFSESEASRMASANPARLLGIEKNHGSIEVGKRADLVAVDEQGNVKLTLIGGKICTRN
ncbi:MAG: N-acetylglucosamine-6-phosphate deacetylase [Acidobacteria bacterium]|jgi:N-acetylglucosamine-6-phosphate deacetylase|nr:N-acetylglucosamine-6-phosphate deacetylase [Acidobacteriota bacterium]